MTGTNSQTEVVIVGGGPAGLSMAALLGSYGVATTLVERRTGTNPHPRARSVNVRTGEIFAGLGILHEIEDISLPQPWTERFVYTETLAGREIGRIEMGVQPIVDGVAVSTAPWLLSSQDRIEPIIRRAAEARGALVRFGTALVDIEQRDDAVVVMVEPRTGKRETIEAAYVVAADGAASTVRRRLGIEMEGQTDLATLVNCQFHANLDPWTTHRPAALYWTTAPARNVFQKIDTNHRWLCQIGYDPRQHAPEDFTPDRAEAWIRESIFGPEPDTTADSLDIGVTDVIPWVMSSTVAERLRHERVFLIGDAAHQLPPSGGFGMNTAVQDAHNLAWKLAYVLQGRATDALLDTYHVERAPIARYNADRSLDNTRSVGRIRKRVEGGGSPDEIAAAVAESGRYGNWLGMDLGLHYTDGCLLPDGSEPPQLVDPVSDYVPCARPGHRAPHLPLSDGGSTLDLYGQDVTLVLGADAEVVPRGPVRLRIHRLQGSEAHRLHGIRPDGGLLVRPDGHVAWRTASGIDGPMVDEAVGQLGFRH